MNPLRPRRDPDPLPRLRKRRRSLLLGGALLVAVQADLARAQAIDATPVTVPGSGTVTYSRFTAPTPGTETITLNTNSAIIEWRPPPSPLDPYVFLPAGNVVTFENGAGISDFAVLNRIITNVPSRFDGQVISRIADSLGNRPGGTVLFSGPGGIVVGPSAVFDVGNLVLTTLDVLDNSGVFITASGGFRFANGDKQPNAAVITEPGSQIIASSENSYVALVAPRVIHGGSAQVNGSTAFIAGEALEFSVDQGLFDIVVTTGSANPTPIVHAGTTGGVASTGPGDNHVIYAVAIPKDQAIQMLLGGDMGYDLAVGVDNGAIVLSAGHNITGGAIAPTPANPLSADIIIEGGTYTSDIQGRATRDALARTVAGSPITASESVTLRAQRTASLVTDGADASIGGALSLTAQNPSGAGGLVRLEAGDGTRIDVAGDVTLAADSDANVGVVVTPPTGADALGGTVEIVAAGGTIAVAGSMTGSATGVGGIGSVDGGNGTGGIVTLDADGGAVEVTGDLTLDARGFGGVGNSTGGDGRGGTARATATTSVGDILVDGRLLVDSSGRGAISLGSSTPGDSFGGNALLEATLSGFVEADAAIIVRADGGAGLGLADGLPPGHGLGGDARVMVDGSSLATPSLTIRAIGVGGSGIADSGFNGQGGSATLELSTAGLTLGQLTINAGGTGGRGAPDVTGGTGGAGTGGTATLTSNGGTSVLGVVNVLAVGRGGVGGGGVGPGSTGGTGGVGRGGEVLVDLDGGGSLSVESAGLAASALGGDGGEGSSGATGGDGGAGGDARGGLVTLTAGGDATFAVSPIGLVLDVSGTAGTGGAGGSFNESDGVGGRGGDGGNGQGGEARIGVAGGRVTVSGSGLALATTDILATGSGGLGGAGGIATGSGDPNFNGQDGLVGQGTGGVARVEVADVGASLGQVFLGQTTIEASGLGSGDPAVPDIAGRIVLRDLGSDVTAFVMSSLVASASGNLPSGAGPAFDLSSTDNPILAGGANISATGDIVFAATGSGGFGSSVLAQSSSGSILLTHAMRAPGAATVGGPVIELTAATSIIGAPGTLIAATNGNAVLHSPIVDIDRITASNDILVDNLLTAGTIDIAFAQAGRDVALDGGDIDVDFAEAGDDFTANAFSFTGGTVETTGAGTDSEDGVGPLVGSNIVVDTIADLRVDVADAAGNLRLTSDEGSIVAPDLRAGGDLIVAALDIDLDTLEAGLDIVIDAPDISFTSATAGRDLTLTATGDIDFGSAEAGDDFLATATGNFTATTVNATGLGPDSEAGLGDLAGSNLTILVAGVVDVGSLGAADDVLVDPISVTIGSVVAGGDITLDATTFILVGSADANDDFVATAGTTFTAGTVIARGVKDGEQGSGSALEGGNIFVDAGDDLRLDNGDAATDIQLTSRLGSVLSATLLDAGSDIRGTAAQNIDLAGAAAGATIGLTATAGFIDAASLTTTTGSITTNSGTDTDIAAAASGASLLVTAGGSADLGTVSAATDVVVGASAITLANGTAARDLQLNAPGAIQVTLASAGDDFTANAGTTFTGGTVTTTGGPDSEAGAGALAGSNIVVDSVGNLRLDNGTAPGAIDLGSTGGSILSSGTLNANRLLANAALNLDLNDVFVVAALDLAATGGLIDGNRFDSNGDINLAASGNITVQTLRAGDDLVVQGGSNGAFTDIQADSIAIDLVGSAGFAGAIRAPTAAVTSANIDIAGTASFGDAATQLVSLTARPSAQQTVIGGAAAGPGYTLTDAEADRITAATLRIQASPTGAAANRAPDLLIRDLSLDGQRIGRLDIRTSGIVQVEGALLVTGVQSTGGVDIRADERLQIVNPAGSLRVRDSAGMTDGSVNLTSNNIWSASQSLLDQLRADSNFAGRDDALAANGGPVEERGYIEAGDVTLFARDSLFVQNSGTAASFAGITVRENTLRLVPTGAQPLRVFAFGRRINPDGSFVTNNAFFNEVQYDGRGGPVGYTADAQLNRCFINTGCPAPPPPNQPQPPNIPGGPEIVTEPVGGSFTLTLPGAADDLVDTSFADEPLIEEPVTSGGDSILWDCDNDDDGDCDEEDYDG